MKPFFSIVIPTLNEEKFVGLLLNDLIKQTYHNFEVIIVDAQSEDATIQKIKKYKKLLPLSKIAQIKVRNVSRQRNTGARLSKGNYLVFLDADSRIGVNFLKKLNSYIIQYKGLLFMPAFTVSKNDPQMSIAVDLANALVGLSTKIGKPFSTGGSMILEKNFFFLIGGFPEDVPLSEDHLLVRNAYMYGVNARLLSHIKVKFSLRRFQREGKLEVFFKYIKSTIYFLVKGKVDKQIIEYEMGGLIYKKESKKALHNFIQTQPQKLLKIINSSISSFLNE